jgi:hypothetical protein
MEGHTVSWNLQYRSTFCVTLSDKGWIGFSRTPHSDAYVSGQIALDGRIFSGDPLGFGVQGHNCGYRHRTYWSWAHACFVRPNGPASTVEALVYEMPLGLFFRKAVFWHNGELSVFHNLREVKRDHKSLQWEFQGSNRDGSQLEASFDGRGPDLHRLPYLRTDCRGSFEVVNNSLARAKLCVHRKERALEELETTWGAVLEIVGG